MMATHRRDRVLLLGGTGFIGAAMLERLESLGRPFVVTGRFAKSRLSELQPGDVTAVIDLAQAWGQGVQRNLDILDRNFDLAITLGARRYIYVSSGGAVYGNVDSLPILETQPTAPLSDYGRGKLAAERRLLERASSDGPQPLIVRPANAYGPRQTGERGQGLIAAAFASARDSKPLTIYGDGKQLRDYIHVDDVASGILAALDHGEPGNIYNIGTGIGTSVVDLLAAIGSVPVEWRPSRATDVEANVLDCSKLRQSSGWRPVISLAEGLDLTRAALPSINSAGC